jgi:hypothetical protein
MVSFLQNVRFNREIVALWEGLAEANEKESADVYP